jgi:RNA polymerase sigma factor (sigma-70 family)
MTDGTDGPAGLEAALLAHRRQLLRFLETLGAGEAAEDLFQELWINLRTRPIAPVGRPLSYLYRAAHNLLRDRYRSARQARIRDRDWHQLTGQEELEPRPPSVERAAMARQSLDDLDRALATLDPRARSCLQLHRLEGASQKEVAIALGVSLSTVESDLRRAYAVLLGVRKRLDLD